MNEYLCQLTLKANKIPFFFQLTPSFLLWSTPLVAIQGPRST